MDDIETIIRCPITFCIFNEPVVAADGITYEREAIIEWIKKRGMSPITKDKIFSEQLIKNVQVVKLVDMYLQFHPEMKDEQFVVSTEFEKNIHRIEANYLNILKCENIKLHKLVIDIIVKHHDNEKVIFHVIDNINSTNSEIFGWPFVHWVCFFCSFNAIKKLVERGAIFNVADETGLKPIHIIVEKHSLDIIKYFLEHVENNNAITKFGENILTIAATKKDEETITYLLTDVKFKELIDLKLVSRIESNKSLSIESKERLKKLVNCTSLRTELGDFFFINKC